MKGAGDSCGTMTSDITTTASPTIPSATPSRPVAIPDYLRKGTGAGSSPRGSPHTPGSSPGGSSIGCSPRGSHRRNLHKKTSNGGGSGPSSNSGSPLPNNNNKPLLCENGMSKNAGSTPQTTRKVYSLANASTTDRYSPNGSPRNTNRTPTSSTAPPKRIKNEKENVQKNNMINSEDTGNNDHQQVNIQPEKRVRKSSKGTGELGMTKRVPRLSNVSRSKDNAVSINPAGASAKGCGNVSVASNTENLNSNNTTIIEPPGLSQSEKLDLLWNTRSIEQGMVRMPTNTLEDLIRKESIEKFYIVEDTPVARYVNFYLIFHEGIISLKICINES